MSKLVIVESPSKAKTIEKYLGKDFSVIASYGHIRDLPSKNGSVDPSDRFKMIWDVSAASKKHIDAILKKAKTADEIYLATDPDREGEAISWHIFEILKGAKALKGKQLSRIVFNEITKNAVKKALESPRDVNQDLVDAYMARRALDYLVGFNVSPVLWRKLPGSRSAGRVQSVALRLIVNREFEIEAFQSEEYWSITGSFKTSSNETFDAKLTHLKGEKLEKFTLNSQTLAESAVAALNQKSYHIEAIEKKQVKRHPAAPFITSTLQQEASRKLGFSASRTMQTAQRLYEGINIGGETTGLITYMRTDGVQLAGEAVTAMRQHIETTYGEKYLPKAPIFYKSKAKNAQEAHEAIRPTDITRTPESMRAYLDDAQHKLYTLIWKRTIACQMNQAIFDQVSLVVESASDHHRFKATGSTLVFDGFLRVYQEGVDDQKASDKDDEKLLPKVSEKENLDLKTLLPKQHFTEPPPRYSEASLVKKLEELGIGRPSTYASILQVLQDRGYVDLEKRQFLPNDRGRIVTIFLENYFKQYVEYDFTANLEEELDDISDGKRKWLAVMDHFWTPFKMNVDSAMTLDIVEVIQHVQSKMAHYLFGESGDTTCPSCGKGTLSLRLGKFGGFLGCSAYPECKYTRPVDSDEKDKGDDNGESSPQDAKQRLLGQDPVTGSDVMLRKGPYGYYVEWVGEVEQKVEEKETTTKRKKKVTPPKPKRVGLLATTNHATFTLEEAMAYKALPKNLGADDQGQAVTVNIGKFGPYVKCGDILASIPKAIDFTIIALEQALTLIQKKKEGGTKPRGQKTVSAPRGKKKAS